MNYEIPAKPDKVYDVATRPQEVHADEQAANLAIVQKYFDHGSKARDQYIAQDARIWSDSRPSDNPVVWGADEVYFGIEGMKTVGEAYANHGFSYDMVIHSMHVSGPVVILCRTDIRRQEGHPDKPIPAVGILAVRDGKIIQWSDWYR